MSKNKKGQINPQELLGLVILGIILLIALPAITSIINAASGGNIENSIDAIINAFIPLFIFAIIFEFLRRFLR